VLERLSSWLKAIKWHRSTHWAIPIQSFASQTTLAILFARLSGGQGGMVLKSGSMG